MSVRPASPVRTWSCHRQRAALLMGAALLMVILLCPSPVRAQQPGGAGAEGWSPVSVGIRFGYDQSANGEVAGAQIRVPVLPSGRVELIPSADVIFLSGLREYGFNLDAVFMPGGRQGGLYLGGGFALRNSIFGLEPTEERSNETGFGAVVGMKTGAPAGLAIQVEFRWIFLPGIDFDPRVVTLGLNYPLWGRRTDG
ncbi:MAG: hypothetical protein WD995_13995 [Gemmatimonadota bacterium]